MEVCWLEQTEADMPRENDWLSRSEALRSQGMRFARRRDDWRLGRWTAKRALAACLNLPAQARTLADIETRSTPSGKPEAFLADESGLFSISLSHRDRVALCAVAPRGGVLGCDLEVVEPRSSAFAADYFTAAEQALVEQASEADRSLLLALLWSGKESALKALGTGLRLDTRCVIVSPVANPGGQGEQAAELTADCARAARSWSELTGWRPLRARYGARQTFYGWWQHTGHFVRTLVATPPPAEPIRLAVLPYRAEDIAAYDVTRSIGHPA
jgi:4'-phosphopantetheinyl transferase